MNKEVLDRISVVLVEPQDDINIGTAMRAARNFGIESTRLVDPASADPDRIAISAPRCESLIEDLGRFDDLDDAIGDCVLTVGMTARRRTANWRVLEPRHAAREVVDKTAEGRVALLFGREDRGLSNRQLDRCHVVVTIPTNPDYSSLNLGQAVTLMLWEIFRGAEGVELPDEGLDDIEVETEFPPAEVAGMERMFSQAEEALEVIEFFKTESHAHIMRTLRSLFFRAGLDERELAIWHGIFKEVVAYGRRVGGDDEDLER